MGWFAGLVGGGLGLMIGGPFGALIGAAIGSSLGNGSTAQIPYGETEKRQTLFFTAAYSMVGKLAKADGRVCEDEVAAIERISREVLGLDAQTRSYAIAILNQSKDSPDPFKYYAAQFGSLFRGDQNICSMMMSFLFEVAMADGELHPSEEAMLREAKFHFGITDSQYQALYQRYVRHKGGASASASPSLAHHYEILGVDSSASDDEIKKAWRRKAAEFHPDKIEAKGLPPEFIKFANDKLAEINGAYDALKKARKAA